MSDSALLEPCNNISKDKYPSVYGSQSPIFVGDSYRGVDIKVFLNL